MRGAIRHIIGAFKYSAAGFKSAFESEVAFRLDILFCAAAAAAICLWNVPAAHKLWLGSTLFFIIAAELANTAIEYAIDRIGMAPHPLSKSAKDAGSALVFTAFAYCAFAWAAVFLMNRTQA
ncbi:MAG: diacylglycerol kinase [Rickettsiales bacterium]|jgi:diacylglycerol kinase (ATP)|nr:diacylglycerol kinase [Rickettsiales bacterium]